LLHSPGVESGFHPQNGITLCDSFGTNVLMHVCVYLSTHYTVLPPHTVISAICNINVITDLW